MPNGELILELNQSMPEQATHQPRFGCVFWGLYAPFAQVILDNEAFDGRLALHRPALGSCLVGLSGDERISEAKLGGNSNGSPRER